MDKFDENKYLINIINSKDYYKNKTKEYCELNNIKYGLIVFNREFVDNLCNYNNFKEIGRFYSGSDYSKIISNGLYVIVSSFLGGPNASALVEELYFYGIKNIFATGTSCKLIPVDNEYMLVKKAIRDEGTSLFYQEPSLYAYTSPFLNKRVKKILNEFKINYNYGITWTIDAYYKEGLNRLCDRVKKGASAIDMESSIYCSVANQLGINFSQLLYYTDEYFNGIWIKRKKNVEIKKNICNIGNDIVKRLVRGE